MSKKLWKKDFWASTGLLTVIFYLIYMFIVQFSLELSYYFSGFLYVYFPIQFFNRSLVISFPLDILFVGGISLIVMYMLSLLDR